MFTVHIAEPKKIIKAFPNATGIVCDRCTLEYALEDYQILKDNNKLLYFWGDIKQIPNGEVSFKADSLLMCHSCFFKELKNVCGSDEISLKVIGAKEETIIQFIPSEIVEDFDDEDLDDSYLGLF